MEKSIGIEIVKILDKYLPADRVGSEREKLRMNLHNELTVLISQPEQEEKGFNKKEFAWEWYLKGQKKPTWGSLNEAEIKKQFLCEWKEVNNG